jgi:hypothetical protein
MKNRTKQDIYTLYLRKRRKGVLRMFTIFKEEKVITAGIFMSQRSGASDAGVDVSYNDPGDRQYGDHREPASETV